MKKYLPLLLLLFCNSSISAQWHYLPGPDGGAIINLERDENTLYALTPTGIYRSIDEGYHWQILAGTRLASQTIDRLIAENGIFYGLGMNAELLRSNDNGQSWQPVLAKPFPIPAPVENLRAVFAKGDTLLVTSFSTIYRSVDRGNTWIPTSNFYGIYQSMIFSAGKDFFSWGGRDIYRSSDGGLTWNRIFSSADYFAAAGAVGNIQFILYGDMKQLLRSTDGFKTWETIETDSLLPVFGVNHYPLKFIGISDTLYCIGKTSFSGCTSMFCYSTDEGVTWHAGNNGSALPIVTTDVIAFGKHLVFANAQTGISHSTDGCKTFTNEQAGLTNTFVKNIAGQGNNIFANGNGAVYYSKNNGIDWEETIPSIETAPCKKYSWMLSTRKRLYLIKKYNTKLYSEDNGTSWKFLQGESLYPVAATQNAIWGHDYQGLHRVSDDGSISVIDLQEHLNGDAIATLLTAEDRLVVLTLTNTALILDEAGTLLNKVPVAPCEPSLLGSPLPIHFDGHNIFLICGHDAYVFAENATDWQMIYPQDWTTGIPLYHNTMTDIATYKGITFIALDGKGIFYTTDATGRFYPLDPPYPEQHPRKICFKDNSLWVSSAAGGLYTLELPLLQADASEKPLFQHSPNPSDGHLHLQSNVFFTDEIQLDVLDMAGRLAGSTILRPGQTWELDFPTLSKGLYVLMLRTPLGNTALKWSVMK